jgi:hypothetical protein
MTSNVHSNWDSLQLLFFSLYWKDLCVHWVDWYWNNELILLRTSVRWICDMAIIQCVNDLKRQIRDLAAGRRFKWALVQIMTICSHIWYIILVLVIIIIIIIIIVSYPADLLVIRNCNSKTNNVTTMLCWLITWNRRTQHLLCCFWSIMLSSNRCLPQSSKSLAFFHNSNVLLCWHSSLATFKMSFNFVGFGRPVGKSGDDGQFICRQYSTAFIWIAKSQFDHSRSLLFICSFNNVERYFSSAFRDNCYGCSVNCSKKIIWKDNATAFVILLFFMKVSEYRNKVWLRKFFFWQ